MGTFGFWRRESTGGAGVLRANGHRANGHCANGICANGHCANGICANGHCASGIAQMSLCEMGITRKTRALGGLPSSSSLPLARWHYFMNCSCHFLTHPRKSFSSPRRTSIEIKDYLRISGANQIIPLTSSPPLTNLAAKFENTLRVPLLGLPPCVCILSNKHFSTPILSALLFSFLSWRPLLYTRLD